MKKGFLFLVLLEFILILSLPTLLEEQLHNRVYDSYGCDTSIRFFGDTEKGFSLAYVSGYCSTTSTDMVYLHSLIDVLAGFLRGFLLMVFSIYIVYIRDIAKPF